MAVADPRPSSHPRRRRLRGAVLAGTAVLAACSSGGGDDDSTLADPPAAETTVAPSAPALPAAAPSGRGTLVLGGASLTFEVAACRLDPDPTEPEAARTLLLVSGTGTSARGDAFSVEVQRFVTTMGDTSTYTDTITYEDPARILQAQRIEVAGQVTDLRDPTASSPLLRPRADGVSGAGLASAPGDGPEQGGIVGLALDATC